MTLLLALACNDDDVQNEADNCITTHNPDQADLDMEGQGDA